MVERWLQDNAQGFDRLSDTEKQSIMHFTFLWSLFEAKVCHKNCNLGQINNSVLNWVQLGCLRINDFKTNHEYFKNRYTTEDGTLNVKFDALRWGRTEVQDDVILTLLKTEDELQGKDLISLLAIVYRLRNNLFHGEKWQYELSDQLENFNHANDILIKCLSIHEV